MAVGQIIGGSKKGLNNVGGAHMAMNTNEGAKKLKENPLSNANLPGGLFTHPGVTA